ncbi:MULTISPECIES: NAD(P)/FAD-dependent oxidoreductase [Olsenella]|uniref:NAD(P)/FAD-dependent oxidoreductase n=1 Tax=Olsenella TaxID=133925 RepID=UPI000782D841|nr:MULTISPECIES: FAD-binding protein [Olsenella]KXB62110.1 FAD dependent oxidoreductase [Olsenella sp. DNF00959]
MSEASGEHGLATIKTDVLIIGAGPAGIFTALGLLRKGDSRSITMVEKGLPVERRSCPKEKTGHCVGCKPCRITTGFSGAGAFSDGKLSLSHEVGGDLPTLIGERLAQETIGRVDQIYLDFGADPHIEGLEHPEEVANIRRRAIKAGLKLVDCPIRHLGTEKAQEIYGRIERTLVEGGVHILFQHECDEVVVEGGGCQGAVVSDVHGVRTRIEAGETIVATGRRGAAWFDDMCEAHGIAHSAGPVDLGVRVEVRNEVMDDVNRVLYESKLVGYPDPFRNKVRTFCQNPGGFVSQENYDGDLAVVNGHSYKERKSPNTNLAVLVSFNFRKPFDQPIVYARNVGKLCNMLGAGHILVQRFGDLLDGKRTWPKELTRSNVVPTLPDAEAGDISAAMPYRAMIEIVEFIKAVDKVVPGFAADETLLYAPELKFYSNRVGMDENFDTNVAHLHCLGDSSGWTRGLMMASVMGLLMGERLASE